jgi:hypothetical protein
MESEEMTSEEAQMSRQAVEMAKTSQEMVPLSPVEEQMFNLLEAQKKEPKTIPAWAIKKAKSFLPQSSSEEAPFAPMSITGGESASGRGFEPMGITGGESASDEGGFAPMGITGGESTSDEGGFDPMGIGGEGADGGDGTVICTELHRQGLMSDEVYKVDSEYGKSLDGDIIRGYQSFGIPIARAMAKSPILTAIVKPMALKWAYHMAGQHNIFGKIALTLGIPVCRWIGKALGSCTHQVSQSV